MLILIKFLLSVIAIVGLILSFPVFIIKIAWDRAEVLEDIVEDYLTEQNTDVAGKEIFWSALVILFMVSMVLVYLYIL